MARTLGEIAGTAIAAARQIVDGDRHLASGGGRHERTY